MPGMRGTGGRVVCGAYVCPGLGVRYCGTVTPGARVWPGTIPGAKVCPGAGVM